MVLKRLEITGFKSFATRTVFEFRPGVTAIVGPNGSGKSNFSDAVRWVLGEQSLSTLRCRRAEELLYGGGGRRPPAGLAEVALTIDNSARILPLDFDEVTVTRRYVRNGDNEYFINRARVRLRDVLAATAPLGGSYALINQGLVDAALSLRPEERRRLFEDAAEIGSFEQRKQDALRRLRETAANLTRVDDLLAELEPRLRALRRQAAQAEQYQALQQELQQLRARWHRRQWREACRQRDDLRATADVAVSRLADVRSVRDAHDRELQRVRDDLRDQRGRFQQLLTQRAELTERLQRDDRALALLGERARSLQARRTDLERQRRDAEQTQADFVRQRAEAHLRSDQLAAQIADLQQRFTAVTAELQPLAERTHRLQRSWRAAVDDGLAATRELTALRSEVAQLEVQIQRISDHAAALATRRAAAAADLALAEEARDAAEAQYTRLVAAERTAQEQEQEARRRLTGARAERSAAEEQRAQIRRELGDLQARYESLMRLQRANSGVFAGVKAALEWAERHNRPGFALVQHLLVTPAEFETAVEVALGARLQHIVVEAWRDAEDAIAELRRSGVGRATFLPLDSLRVSRRDTRISPSGDGVFGIAADLVTTDEHYNAVREQLLGRLLLVRDLPTARRELRSLPNGWQIATLAGDIASGGGSVSGGAPVREQGVLRRERETRELPTQIGAAERRLQLADETRAAADREVQAAQAALQAAEIALQDARRQVAAAAGQRDAAVRRSQDLQHEQTRRTEQAAQLERDGRQAAEQRQALLARREAIELAQHEADRRQKAFSDDLEAARADEVALRNDANRLQAEITGLQGQQSATRQELGNVERRLAALSDSVERFARTQHELEQSAADIADESAALQLTIEEIRRSGRLLQLESEPLEQQLQALELAAATAEAAVHRAQADFAAAERDVAATQAEVRRAVDRVDAVFERAVADDVDPQNGPDDGDGDVVTATALDELRQRLVRLGSVNLLALDEFREQSERYRFLTEQAADLRTADTTIRTLIGELETAMHDRFSRTFHAVAAAFSQTFPRLFGGGSAQLQLVAARSGEETSTQQAVGRDALGVEVLAQPPGKRRQPISLLSGGERSLTAVALLFAILQVNPSPFCILDETDAALDESNVGRFRAMFAELTARTQFMLITHNRGTVEAADHLYGVTLADDGSSRIVSLQIADYVGDNA